jgi:predicted nucleic acid-binding protein
MILVDAGVLIDFLRLKDAKLAGLFRSLPLAICGVTRAEVLAGARGDKDRQRLFTFLGAFQPTSMPDSTWDVVGETWHRFLRAALRYHFRMPWSPRLPSRGRWKFGRMIRIFR